MKKSGDISCLAKKRKKRKERDERELGRDLREKSRIESEDRSLVDSFMYLN